MTIGPLAKPVDISYNAKGEFAGQAIVYFQAANVRPFSLSGPISLVANEG